jgi:two-component system, OmpR family, sensor histidine kinase VanS
MRKMPIYYRFFIYFIVFAIILVFSLWLFQSQNLPDFYYSRIVNRMNDEIDELVSLVDQRNINEQTNNIIQNYQARITSTITVYQLSGSVAYGKNNESTLPINQLIKIQQGETETIVFDGAMGYLEVYRLTENYIYRLKIPYQSLGEIIDIINALYLVAVLVAFLLSLLLSLVFSRQIADPIRKLSQIAKKMESLDFSVLYEDDRRDEIGALGQTLNKLGEALTTAFKKLETELERAHALEKLRASFVSSVSHELQTPLAVILGVVEALEDHVGSEEDQLRYFEMLKKESFKMSTLSKDLLDLSQLEAGQFAIKKENINLIECVESVLFSFQPLALKEDKEIKFINHLTKYDINADQFRIEQVITNLLNNALHHAPKYSSITVELSNDDRHVLIAISNLGPRIEDLDLPHLFDTFYKARNKHTGSGLGLAIVRQIVKLHQGTYQVENLTDGVKFTIQLPLASS